MGGATFTSVLNGADMGLLEFQGLVKGSRRADEEQLALAGGLLRRCF